MKLGKLNHLGLGLFICVIKTMDYCIVGSKTEEDRYSTLPQEAYHVVGKKIGKQTVRI